MALAGEHEGDYLPIAEHGMVGDLHTIALVGTNGRIDWYCCPAFDSPSIFGAILDKDDGGFYTIRPSGDEWTSKQLYFPDTNVLITRFFTPGGVGELQDFMPIEDQPRAASPPAHPARRGGARRGRLHAGGPAPLRLRARGARGRDAPSRGAVPGAVADARARGRDREDDGLRTPAAARRRRGDGHVHGRRGGVAVVRARARAAGPHLPPVSRARDGQRVRGDRDVLAPLARSVALPRALARAGPPLGADAQAADLRADGRAGGRADHVAARAARRRAQLGLPLHVDPRRGLLALRPAAARLHGGGGRVHGLADRPHARVEDHGLGAAADHVRHRRPLRPARDRAPDLGRLPRLGARADRQRRGRPAPARHLRRADRLRLPLQQVRRADLPRDLGQPAADHRLAVRELGPGRRGHLGDARRPEGLHLLAADVLGGARARDPHEPRARPAGRHRALARRARPRSTTRS